MSFDTQTQNGFALPVALLALMVMGALVTGAFYTSSRDVGTRAASDLDAQAFYLAEYGLDETLGTWRNATLARVVGPQIFDPIRVMSGDEPLGSYRIAVRPLGTGMFLVSSEGRAEVGSHDVRRQVGVVVRTVEPDIPVATALAVLDGLRLEGAARIRGEAAHAPECPAGPSAPGVTAPDTLRIWTPDDGRISGAPAMAEAASLNAADLSRFGGLHLSDLIAAATRTYEHGESAAGMAPVVTVDRTGTEQCDNAPRGNWGDATGTGACDREFPIIHAKGDLLVRDGSGQGILIVDGDLRVRGDFEFHGLVIVRGDLDTDGAGNHLEGSVIVQGSARLDAESTPEEPVLIRYSACAVGRAFDAALRPRPLSKRSWIDFSAAGSAGAGRV
jgi:hypothetical protein